MHKLNITRPEFGEQNEQSTKKNQVVSMIFFAGQRKKTKKKSAKTPLSDREWMKIENYKFVSLLLFETLF